MPSLSAYLFTVSRLFGPATQNEWGVFHFSARPPFIGELYSHAGLSCYTSTHLKHTQMNFAAVISGLLKQVRAGGNRLQPVSRISWMIHHPARRGLSHDCQKR